MISLENVIRKMVLAAAIMALPFLVNAAEDEFYGTYTLISTSRTRLDTGQVETFARERGFITYGKDGRMMVIIVRGDRPKAESIEKMTDQQRAELHRLMTAYGGTYKFDGKQWSITSTFLGMNYGQEPRSSEM